VPAAAPIPGLVATPYDPPPDGDGSENESTAAAAVDGQPGTAWRTETYRGSADVNGKPGVGLILDAGDAVRATQLRLTTTAPGWSGQVYLTRDASAPGGISGWTPASAPFRMTGPTRSIALRGGPARLYLVWITELAGSTSDWSATIAEASLLGPRESGS
jgi:hypothetical protein